MPRYLVLIERIASKDPRVQWTKLSPSQAQQVYQVDELWEAKANRKYRLFVGTRNGSIPILGFGHRGQNGVFRRER